MRKRDRITKIKKQVGRFCLGLGLLGLAQLVQAAPLSGKVFLDYDNSGSNTNAPLGGLAVELLDSAGAPLSTPLTTTTAADGSYSFNTPTLGSFKVKAKTANSESETISVSVAGASGISGQNVFLKGNGGDIQLRIKDTTAVGVQNIPVIFSASGYANITTVTDASGYVDIKNSLTGVSYKATVLPSDIVDDMTNAKQYALWDATLANGSNAYVSDITFAMSGTNQTGSFNVRERNEWGGDGIVAVDQDDNGVYSAGIDTPIGGFDVELFYKGTSQKVMGIDKITVANNGKYNFKNLPLGDYTVKLSGVSSPWIMVTATQNDFSVVSTAGNPSAFDFLLNVDPNDTTLATIKGYVFSVGDNEVMGRGPDSGSVLNQGPTSESTRLQLPLDLYQFNGTSWSKISSITTKTDGSYVFKGLKKNEDYKVKIANDSSLSGSYIFSNDFDGKSPVRNVTLSSGFSESIAEKEIVVVNLASTKLNHNFIYSNTTVEIYAFMQSPNILYPHNNTAHFEWGGSYFGFGAESLASNIKVKLYEEDGVTPVNSKSGALAEWWVTGNNKKAYHTVLQTKVEVNHKSVYVLKVIDYDTVGYPAGMSTITTSIYINTPKPYTQNAFEFKGTNEVTGRFFLNNSNSGGFVSGTDIPLQGIQVVLYRLQEGTTIWNRISVSATNNDGKYGFTNLPNGQYKVLAGAAGALSVGNAVTIEGDVDNITPIGTVAFDLSAGNTKVINQDIWYKLTKNDYVFKGAVYLDTYKSDGAITKINPHHQFDFKLPDATVLLCKDSGNINDCSLTGSDYIDHQITNINGSYEFNSTTTPSLAAGTNYLVKAYRDDVIMYDNANVKSYYQVSTPFTGFGLPVEKNFLAKGKTTTSPLYAGKIGNDRNGDRDIINAVEHWYKKGYLQYWDTTTNSWVNWEAIGDFYGSFYIFNFPTGKYRHHFSYLTNDVNNDFWVVDSDPYTTDFGIIEFEVLPDGSFKDGLGNGLRNLYLAQPLNSGVTEAVNGSVYLDITGSESLEDAVLLPSNYLMGASVKGFFTPRLYPNYFKKTTTALDVFNNEQPDYLDTALSSNNSYFAFTDSNKVKHADFRYTNFLMSLEGLSSDFTIIANSSENKASYLPTAMKNDLKYMQVNGSANGVTNQYWLVKLNKETEISGRLYYDYDQNGSYNPGDTPMTGIRVELWRNGAFYGFILTDANGNYKFSGLVDGTYQIRATTTGLDTTLYQVETPASGSSGSLTLNMITNPKIIGNDFTYKKIGDASISGHVVVDINNNGIVDINFDKTGDITLENVVVELHKNAISSTPYKSVQTNAKGYYTFTGIDLNANYIVRMVTPTGYGVIKNANGATTNTLTAITIGAAPISASNQYFLLAGGSNSNPAGGNGHTAATNSGISGKTVIDDGSNTPLPNVLLGLIDNSGIEIARQVSDSSGDYHFYNLPSDTYKVNVISSPSGYAIVKNADGTTQPLDTLSGIALATSGVGSKSFWYKTASVNGIQGKVYVDFANASTSTTALDSHAHLIGNSNAATVELYDGTGATGTKLMTTTTVNGEYKFPNLIFGTGVNYSVKIDMTSITDYAFKLSKSGSASTHVVIDVANLPSAGSVDNHYVVKGKQKITGDVWIDVDGDLTQGATGELLNGVAVKLEYKAPAASAYSTLKTMNTANISAVDGQYSFTDLPKGTDYKVTVDSASTVLAGTSLIPATGTGSIANNTNVFESLALSADVTGQSTAYKYNGKVSGQFIVDIDGNGAKSAVDTDFAGVELELTATINSVVITKTATTGTDGKFSIDNLPIGNWSLNVAGTQTVTNWSSYSLSYSKNSAGTKVTGSSALPLTMAITATDTTFANMEVAYHGGAKISGYVVLDVDPTDGTNAVTAIDTPVKNLTLTLSSDTAGFVSRTVTTDNNGYYEFTDLGIHTYKVSVDSTDTQLAGHLNSFDPKTSVTNTSSHHVNLAITAANDDLTTQDFGYKSGGSLSGYIYRDISGSGTRHSAVDDKLAGVKIKATQGSVVRYSNLTTANGEYKIEHLATGLWTVEIDTVPSSDHSYSYVSDTFGQTATVVANGLEVDILPTALTRGVKGATASFGVRANAIISGKVVIDVDDQDPLPPAAADVTASDIAIDATGFFPTYVVSLYNGSTLLTTTTVTGGNYAFTNLADNVAYRVEVSQPSTDYINSFTLTSSSTGVSAGTVTNTAAKMSQIYTLAATNTHAQNSHFAWKGAGGISGEVFWDKDDNGAFNNSIDSDVGAPVTVTLSHASGSVPNITRTIASGSTAYSATGLLPGQWTVTTSGVPTTFKASFDPDDAYSTSSLASTADTATVTITGSTKTGQHFGYVKGGSMVGEVKNDASASGSYNSGDAGVNPVEVLLLDTTDTAIVDTAGNPISTRTNSNGEFSFRNLDPTMDYHVRVTFGSAVASTDPLAEMEPSYDSEVGTISLIPPVSSTVDVTNETHTILAAVSTAANKEITVGNLYFGYRAAGGDLTIHKVALKDNVVVGDIVPYTITIENNKATTAFNITMKDIIPAGFKYVPGSARLDGQKIDDPTGGRPIYFGPMNLGGNGSIGGLPSKRTLSYMLVVGAGVTQGEYTNVAEALDRRGQPASNISQATVTVTSDPLFNDSLIFGKVFVDRNGNGVQDEGEEGLGGVKLVTARGEIITTDAQGRYHLTGVDGGRWERGTNFILKLDVRSLPKGYQVEGRNPRVVRLSPGLPSKIDFKVRESK